ncbi:MAG: recombinase family protein [Muribaculaceae bacterium]|nr:recombinase family protein [Muribaculaceae bacterium]
MKSAIIYARVSSVGDRQSTERQVADLRRYAEYSNLTVAKTFEEHISGATRNAERSVLLEAISYAKSEGINQILISELSRLGRNVYEVLSTVKEMIDAGINIYFQKEQFNLLDENGKPSLFAPIMIATLSTCAQLERDNIQFRLNSGRKHYIDNGGKLGRKAGSTKSKDTKEIEYHQVLKELRRGTSVRRTAKLCDVSASTVTRLKKEFDI